MAVKSQIEWTEASWNPITGCNVISEGCKNCYAKVMAENFQRMGVEKYKDGFAVRMHEKALDLPRKWKKPKLIFVNAMADVFHDEVPFEFVEKMWKVMEETPQHRYQVLTKRPQRMVEFYKWSGRMNQPPLPNVWMGVTSENQRRADERIPYLQMIPAALRYVSCEPHIAEIDLTAHLQNTSGKLDWVISGGETGVKSRELKLDWVRKMRDDCVSAGVPFFFKQIGSFGGRTGERKKFNELDGEYWMQFPDASPKLQVGNKKEFVPNPNY